MSKSLYIGVFF